MSMEMIREYIDPQLFIVVPMLWGIGMALKKKHVKKQLYTNCSFDMFLSGGTVVSCRSKTGAERPAAESTGICRNNTGQCYMAVFLDNL